nr:polysaccharide biosynthesis/export family protein [Novosphingobium sp. FKTRR1]
MHSCRDNRSRPASLRRSLVLGLALLCTACASLPESGPTGSQIRASVARAETGPQIQIVEVTDAGVVQAAQPPKGPTLADLPTPATDVVGPGDVLDVAVYEAGVTLFGSTPAASLAAAAAFDSAVKVERLPPTKVDDRGDILVPYGGRLHVAGRSTAEIGGLIRQSLHGMSQNPQVLVTLREVVTNSVIVGGEIAKPGRLVLTTNQETLPDAIALAGGWRGESKDLKVRVRRGAQEADFRLSDLLADPAQPRVYPGDRITVIRAPRSWSVMGASGRVDLIPFAAPVVTLAEAIAQAGGTNPNVGDPRALFVFRYETGADGAERPVVYHLNMMQAGSYFLAQRFQMRDKDVLYIGNARANQPSKLIQIISQLFTPLVTVTSAVQVLKN